MRYTSAHPCAMREEDVFAIQQLIDVAVDNEFYDVAEDLRRARDLLNKKLSQRWAGELLFDVEQLKDR